MDNTKVLVHGAVRGVAMERDNPLNRVRILEEEKVQVQERVTFVEGEVVGVTFNAATMNDSNNKLQQRVRVNALLTDKFNEACFAQYQPKPQPTVQPPPPTYHEQNLLSVN